jgi:hypothetical protein
VQELNSTPKGGIPDSIEMDERRTVVKTWRRAALVFWPELHDAEGGLINR